MFKRFFIILLTSFILNSSSQAFEQDFITYEWLCDLGTRTGYTDHIPHWRRLFNTMKVRGFLECGLGYSTSYFLKNADKVISIEYITPDCGDKWYKECLNLFKDHENWIPLLYNAELRSNSFNNACAYQCYMHQDYALIDSIYIKELVQHFKSLIKKAEEENYEIDVAFVDPGIYIRGDMVNLLLDLQIPIVVSHHTEMDNGTEKGNLYGWNKVKTPENYVKIYIPFGKGTTFWISNQLPNVITSIQAYRDSILHIIDLKGIVDIHDMKEIADEIL